MRSIVCFLLLALGQVAAVALPAVAPTPAVAPGLRPEAVHAAPVLVLTLNGGIGPASADYVRRGFAKAAAINAQLIVLRMDTPGGLDLSMRAIIKDILASRVPVASFVAPDGARAASAGTYILYASHISAMAPATNLGAATPVALGGGETGGEDRGEERAQERGAKPGAAAPQSTMGRKQTNDAAAYIRSLAQLRGRNAAWAEQAVRDAVSLSAQEALRLKVIDLIAIDVRELLQQLDGRSVALAGATSPTSRQLATRSAVIIEFAPDWRARVLMLITDPSIAYVLLLVGFYGLVFEFMNPGLIAPGVIGGICLVVALFALQMLPVNYAGLALILLGVGLLVAEHFAAGIGVLGFGGVAALAIGSVMLIDTDVPGYRISWALVAGTVLTSTLFLMTIVNIALRARRKPVVSGSEQLIGTTAEVVGDSAGTTFARVQGELWQVRADRTLNVGQRVQVVAIDGLVLSVQGVLETDSESVPEAVPKAVPELPQ